MVIITDKRTKEGREFRSWMKFVCLCDGYEPTDHEYSDSVRLMPVRFNWRSRIKKGFNSLKELKSEIKEAYNEIKNRERLFKESEDNYHFQMKALMISRANSEEVANYLVIKRQFKKWEDSMNRAIEKLPYITGSLSYLSDEEIMIKQCVLLRSLIRHILRGEDHRVSDDWNGFKELGLINNLRGLILRHKDEFMIAASRHLRGDLKHENFKLEARLEDIARIKLEIQKVKINSKL